MKGSSFYTLFLVSIFYIHPIFSAHQVSKTGKLSEERNVKGLKQNIFVDKQHIIAPTGLSVSPEGVVFVSCDRNGASNKEKLIGKVVRCEDTDGDGVADKFSNFVEGIDSPRGSCYVGDTLYLMQPPYLVAYQDKDKDGIAETKKVLIKNLGQPLKAVKVDHGQNGVRMAIDGWLYLAIGDQGCYKSTGTDGSQATLYGGGIVRLRPDGTKLEVIVRGTRNTYDLAIDPYMNIFARDNTNDGGGWNTRFHYMTELSDFGYPHLYKYFGNEAMLSLIDYGGGSGTGMYYLHEPGFPEDYGDALYSGDFNTGLAMHRRKTSEASFQIKQTPFMNSPKNMDIDVDGYSRIYAASWLGGGFGHTTTPFGHVDLITLEDSKSGAVYPVVNTATDKKLLNFLTRESQVLRINVMCEIVKRGSKKVFSEGLQGISKNTKEPLYTRVAALLTLKQIDGNKSHEFIASLYEDLDLREFVVRALGDEVSDIDNNVVKYFYKALKDSNPRVRMRAIIGLAKSGNKEAAKYILPLAKSEKIILDDSKKHVRPSGEDGYSAPHEVIPHTALKAVVKLDAIELCLNKLEDTELRETALRCLQEIHDKRVVDGLISKLHSSKDAELNNMILLALFRLYHKSSEWNGKSWWGTRPSFKGPYFKCVEWEETEKIQIAIRTAFKKVSKSDYPFIYKMIRRNQIKTEDLDLGINFDEAITLMKKSDLTDEEIDVLVRAANDESRSVDQRMTFYEYLKNLPLRVSYKMRAKVLGLWGTSKAKEPAFRQAYEDYVGGNEFVGRVNELRYFLNRSREDQFKYSHILLFNMSKNPVIPKASRDLALKEIDASWGNGQRTLGMLKAFEEVDPSPYRKKIEEATKHKYGSVRKAAEKILAERFVEKLADTTQRILEVAPEKVLSTVINTKGDAKLGEQIFKRQGCQICHTTSSQEGLKGPYLGKVGSKFDRHYIAESIHLPNEKVSQGFRTYWYKLKNKQTVQGFVTRSEGDELDIRDIIGQITTVKISDVLEHGEHETSMMPAGLMMGATVHEFASLVDYLQTLK